MRKLLFIAATAVGLGMVAAVASLGSTSDPGPVQTIECCEPEPPPQSEVQEQMEQRIEHVNKRSDEIRKKHNQILKELKQLKEMQDG